ncbi:MAG: BlaI/MecI/CopY family transcriptional regulator [Oscillospiraceae bacterium]|nr:BlaI/MecI/CopY family transcriptional regulator [Oscillospiraceae bacterium]
MKLTDKEFEVMNLFWLENKPLSAKEIMDILPPDYKYNTVRAVLKSLLDAGFISVDSYFKSGNTYGRRYKSAISMERYLADEIAQSTQTHQNKSQKMMGIFAALVGDGKMNKQALIEMQKLIEDNIGSEQE